jgi:F-type H+-transporting ATPase subunit gamma
MTKAMKMVAASKLRRAKQAVESSRPYAKKIDEIIFSLAASIKKSGDSNNAFPLLSNSNNKTHLIVVLSSDRGLCGGLNSSAVKFAKNHINSLIKDGKEVKILCIGKKGYDQLKSLFKDDIVDNIFGIFKNDIDYKIAQDIADKIIVRFKEEEFDICEVIYSKFKSAISQEASLKQIIPIKINQEDIDAMDAPIDYEPNQEDLLDTLLPKNLAMQIYNELLENSASEQGARMAAMESATNNANKMIKNLELVYNRTRQANITKELIDIVSGANVAGA